MGTFTTQSDGWSSHRHHSRAIGRSRALAASLELDDRWGELASLVLYLGASNLGQQVATP